MSDHPMDLELSFAQWRLDNPGVAGCPFDAFTAGWCAREAVAKMSHLLTAPERPLIYGFDVADGYMTMIVMRRNGDNVIEVLAEKTVELPI